MTGGASQSGAPPVEPREPIALHDQALWRELTGADDAGAFGAAWLALGGVLESYEARHGELRIEGR